LWIEQLFHALHRTAAKQAADIQITPQHKQLSRRSAKFSFFEHYQLVEHPIPQQEQVSFVARRSSFVVGDRFR